MIGITDIIIIVILVVIVGAAVAYIIKAKKNGAKCIGCPDSGSCGGNCGGSCNCGCGGEKLNDTDDSNKCCCDTNTDENE